MYHLIKAQGLRRVLKSEAPPAAAALIVAEFLYKFGSFYLECLAFLATWYGLSLTLSVLQRAQRQGLRMTNGG